MSFRVTQTNIWSQRWWADLSPTAAHIYHWVYSNQRTDGACSSGLYHALLTDIMSGAHIRDQNEFDRAFQELIDARIVVYDYENALLLDTRFVTDQLVNANQLKGALAYLGSLDPFPIVMMATKLVRTAFERTMEPSRGNPSDTLPEEPYRNPPREHRIGKKRKEEDRKEKDKKTLSETSIYDSQIDALMTGFEKDERELVAQFIVLAIAERKTGKLSPAVRMRYVNEIHQLKHDYPTEFKAGLTETVDRGIPNTNYAKAVMRGMGKRRQKTLNLWANQKRREEYDAKRIAKEKADRGAEKTREETKRRQRAREEAVRAKGAWHGPWEKCATGDAVRGPRQGRSAAGDRRGGEAEGAQGRGAVVDGGRGAAVVEVPLSDYLPGGPGAGGAEHGDGAGPGDGDAGPGAVVSAPGDRVGARGRLLGERQ